ncbi:unnamed protein product [Stanieria sp. NIES-3757]|nr:unnamed protein product [Stanieria sp. NIES-3757]
MSISSLANSVKEVGSFVNKIPSPPGGIKLGILSAPLVFIVNEAINARPLNEGEDEFLRKLKNPYKPSKLVDTVFEQPAPYYGGGVSGVQYKMHIRFRKANGEYEEYVSGSYYTGVCTWGTPVATFNHGTHSTSGLNYYNWNIPFTYNNGVASSISWVAYNEAKPLGWIRVDGNPDVNPPPVVPGVKEQGAQNPVVSGEPPYTNDEFFKKFGLPPRINQDFFAPPLPGAKAPPQITPVPTGDTFPNANQNAPASAPPITDPAKDVPKINTAPASSDNTYTRTYTKTGSDAWGSTPGIRTYSPGVDNLGLKSPASVKPSSQGGVTAGGGVTPLNPPTTSNPPVIDVPTPSNTDNLITALGSTLALILDQTSKAKIKEATGEAVCEKTSSGQCLSNMFNGKPSWADGLNAGLEGVNLLLSKEILAIVKNTNQVINHPKYGLLKIQEFADTAWKATRADKILNVINTALILHNAIMLSNNVAYTITEIVDNVLATFNIKDHEDKDIDVSSWISGKFQAIVTSIIGAENYSQFSTALKKANRIYQASANVLWGIRDIMDSAQNIAELTGENVSIIGNALRKCGVVRENIYGRMPENINASNAFLKRMENIQEGLDLVEEVSQDTRDVKETWDEMKDNKKEFDDAVNDWNKDKDKEENNVKKSINNLSEEKESDTEQG